MGACVLGLISFLAAAAGVVAKPAAVNAEELRLVQAMSDRLRARIDELPVLLPAGQPVGQAADVTVTLNRTPVVVDGRRFDGIVFTAPSDPASFAWAFACPPNASRWYVFREHGDMRGFANFIRRPRAKGAAAVQLEPVDVPLITFQKLDAASLSPGARYVIWFGFKDDAPVQCSIRAGFYGAPLVNERLPGVLFPVPAPAKAARAAAK